MPTNTAINQMQQFIIAYRPEVQDLGSDKPLVFHGLRHTCAAKWYISLKAKGYSEFQACMFMLI